MHKDVVIIALALLSLGLASCSKLLTPSPGNGLEPVQLRLILDKERYGLAEPTKVTLVLANTTQEQVLVNARMAHNRADAPNPFREVTFVIIGPDGRQITTDARIDVGFPSDGDFTYLAPGRPIERTYTQVRDLYTARVAGAYSIQAVYENRSDPSFGAAWKGKVTSSPVTFVLEP